MEDEQLDFIQTFSGTRLDIFCVLLQMKEPIGSRDVQRLLDLKSRSHASYHLQQMLDHNLLRKTPQNKYILKDEFRMNSIRVNVATEYYLISGRFWPKSVLFATFLVCSILFGGILLFMGQLVILSFFLFLSLIASLVFVILEIRSSRFSLLNQDESK